MYIHIHNVCNIAWLKEDTMDLNESGEWYTGWFGRRNRKGGLLWLYNNVSFFWNWKNYKVKITQITNIWNNASLNYREIDSTIIAFHVTLPISNIVAISKIFTSVEKNAIPSRSFEAAVTNFPLKSAGWEGSDATRWGLEGAQRTKPVSLSIGHVNYYLLLFLM